MKQEIEQQVIDQAIDGDSDAFSEIYFLLKNSIYGFAYRMTRQNSVAEEITQDVFMSFIEKPTKYDPNRGPLFLYLCGITRYKVLNHLRKRGTRLEENDIEESHLENLAIQNVDSPSDNLLKQELSGKIEASVARLTTFQREAILLREIEELSYGEIAKITQSDIGTVKSRLYRARRALEEELDQYVNSEEVTTYEVHRN